MEDKQTTNLTISLSKEELKALRRIALESDMSVSALIRKWIKDRKEEKGEK